MNPIYSPALRPSHPPVCRKRASGQGHALPGRFAGLDQMPLLSGYGCLRATDKEASGGGSIKGSSQFIITKATTQKNVSHLSRLSLIPTRGGHNTCKPASAYAPQSVPDTYGVVSSPTFKCPPRHVHHADRSVSRILTAQFPHGVQAFAAYRLPVNRMFTRRCHHINHQRAGYNSAPRLIRTRHTPDARIMHPRFCAGACSFVRHCL